MRDEQMIRTLLLDKAGLRIVLRRRGSILRRQLLSACGNVYAYEESTQVVVLCFLALLLLPINHSELAFQDVRATVGAGTPSLQQLQQLLRYVE